MTAKTPIFVIAALAFLEGCFPTQQRGASYLTTPSADSGAAKYRAENDDFIRAAEQGVVPKDYRQKVDRWMVENLKDPDSRKVEFGKASHVVACGTVNAKNSYGGYTGKKPFTAWFTAGSEVEGLLMWTDKDLATWEKATLPSDLGYKYHWLMAACGYLDAPLTASIDAKAGRDPNCVYSADGIAVKCPKKK